MPWRTSHRGGVLTAFLWASAWPDLIVGLGIAAMNADAAREVWQAALEEHNSKVEKRDGILDERKLSTRDVEKLTGVSHSEFTRIRYAQLRRFTLDRIIAILGKLVEDVEVNVTFRPRQHGTHAAPHVR
jgi:Co/Zn/Cd efflux system component